MKHDFKAALEWFSGIEPMEYKPEFKPAIEAALRLADRLQSGGEGVSPHVQAVAHQIIKEIENE